MTDATEWIAWTGGECPVASSAFVEVKCRYGPQNVIWNAGRFPSGWWRHDGASLSGHQDDIIAYRLASPAYLNQVAECAA